MSTEQIPQTHQQPEDPATAQIPAYVPNHLRPIGEMDTIEFEAVKADSAPAAAPAAPVEAGRTTDAVPLDPSYYETPGRWERIRTSEHFATGAMAVGAIAAAGALITTVYTHGAAFGDRTTHIAGTEGESVQVENTPVPGSIRIGDVQIDLPFANTEPVAPPAAETPKVDSDATVVENTVVDSGADTGPATDTGEAGTDDTADTSTRDTDAGTEAGTDTSATGTAETVDDQTNVDNGTETGTDTATGNGDAVTGSDGNGSGAQTGTGAGTGSGTGSGETGGNQEGGDGPSRDSGNESDGDGSGQSGAESPVNDGAGTGDTVTDTGDTSGDAAADGQRPSVQPSAPQTPGQ